MPEGDGFIYAKFKEWVMEGLYNLASGSHQINVSLHTGYTPNTGSHSVWSDVSGTEYGTGAGYTAGGKALLSTTVDVVLDAQGRGKFDAGDPTWTSLGPLTPNTPSHTIMRDVSVSGTIFNPLIACWVLGTTPTNGGDYTLQFGASGIILLQ